jgi:pimeloyl-ACP methyl ester carboxylesterase
MTQSGHEWLWIAAVQNDPEPHFAGRKSLLPDWLWPGLGLEKSQQEGAAMSFYEKGPVRIHFEEKGSGFPLLMIAGGGLNSAITNLSAPYSPFNAMDEFKYEYRCIGADLRNANSGQSTGPLEIDRPWDSHTDDHLGLLDHLRVDKFMVLGFCIGGPMIWNLLKRAPDRIVAAVLAQPSGSRPEMRDLFYDNNMKGWGPELVKRRSDITMEQVEKFLTRMYRTNPDFVFTVTRDFVRTCRTPVLILPDDIPAHPYAVAMEAAMLAPNAEVSMFPWKEPKERIPLAVRQIRSFLRAHRPAAAADHDEEALENAML